MAPRETLPWIILCIRMVWLFARILLSHTRCTKVQRENGNDIAAIVRIFWRNFFFCILFLCSVFVLSSRCFISLFFHSFTVCVCVCVPFFFVSHFVSTLLLHFVCHCRYCLAIERQCLHGSSTMSWRFNSSKKNGGVSMCLCPPPPPPSFIGNHERLCELFSARWISAIQEDQRCCRQDERWARWRMPLYLIYRKAFVCFLRWCGAMNAKTECSAVLCVCIAWATAAHKWMNRLTIETGKRCWIHNCMDIQCSSFGSITLIWWNDASI